MKSRLLLSREPSPSEISRVWHETAPSPSVPANSVSSPDGGCRRPFPVRVFANLVPPGPHLLSLRDVYVFKYLPTDSALPPSPACGRAQAGSLLWLSYFPSCPLCPFLPLEDTFEVYLLLGNITHCLPNNPIPTHLLGAKEHSRAPSTLLLYLKFSKC